jgi:nicotinate-nucleotide adenylyltransferase
MKRVALFGGSFNPIHLGHLAMAQLAFDHFKLDEVLFIPAGEHPFAKESLTVSADERAEMVELALSDQPHFFCYRGEIEREGTSFAIDTILEVKQLCPEAELFYIIGADNLSSFHRWARYEDILNEVTLIVASRPGFEEKTDLPNVQFFPSPQWGLSSTVIREYLSQNLSCRYLIHDSVIEYVKKNSLYLDKGIKL